ncbi:MAG: type II toxin-antitoxin system VapB family antitoxin [Cyanobacteria bacterium P01_F01_bin.143]
MKVQLQIDDNLLKEALALGEHHNQQVLVEEALNEYIQRRKQIKILDLFGTIEYDESYDYKKQRQGS